MLLQRAGTSAYATPEGLPLATSSVFSWIRPVVHRSTAMVGPFRGHWIRSSLLERCADPGYEPRPNLVAVSFVEHLVSATGVQVGGDVVKSRVAVTGDLKLDPRQLLAHGILTARKEIDGQVGPY